MVDLTKIGRKRMHSLEDSKHSSIYNASGSSTRDHFPAAGEYDHNGYLEPRGTKGGGRYLELMNYAPELRELHDPYGNPLVSGNGPAFSSVHVTRKGYHPSQVTYTLLPPEDLDDSECHRGSSSASGGDVFVAEDPRYYCQSSSRDIVRYPYGLISVEESPIYSQVFDDRQNYSSYMSGRQFGNTSHHPQLSLSAPAAAMMKSSHQRKYSDQDLYSSTAPYRQRHLSSSSSTQDHRYASVECNNNRNSTSNSNFISGTSYLCDSGSSISLRNRHGSSSSCHTYAKVGLGYPMSVNLPPALEDVSSKLSTSEETWANNSDDVFIDNDMSQCSAQLGSEFDNYQSQAYQSSRSHIQVYPDENVALVGYETAQVSLV